MDPPPTRKRQAITRAIDGVRNSGAAVAVAVAGGLASVAVLRGMQLVALLFLAWVTAQ